MSNTGPKKLPTLRESKNPEQVDMFQRDVRNITDRIWDTTDGLRTDVDAVTTRLNTLVPPGSGAVTSVTGTGVISVSPITGDVVVSADLSGYSPLSHTHPESDVTGLVTDLSTINTTLGTKADKAITISTTAPLAGGGDLSANRTFSVNANGITDSLLRQGAAASVVGRSAATIGNVADIASVADGDVLRRASGILGFGAIPESSVTNLVSDLASKLPVTNVSGTTNTVAKFTGTNTIGNSSITDNGASVSSTEYFTTSNGNGFQVLGAAASQVQFLLGQTGQRTWVLYEPASSNSFAVWNDSTGNSLVFDGSGNALFPYNLSTNGNATLGDTNSADTHAVHGALTSNGYVNTDAVTVTGVDGGAQQTATSVKTLNVNGNVALDNASSVTRNRYGIYSDVTLTRALPPASESGSVVGAYAAYLNADISGVAGTGGTRTSYALYANNGDAYLNASSGNTGIGVAPNTGYKLGVTPQPNQYGINLSSANTGQNNGVRQVSVVDNGSYLGNATTATISYGLNVSKNTSCSDGTVVNGKAHDSVGIYIDSTGDTTGDNAVYPIALQTYRGDNYLNTDNASDTYHGGSVIVNPSKKVNTELVQPFPSGYALVGGGAAHNQGASGWGGVTGNLHLKSGGAGGGTLYINDGVSEPVSIAAGGGATTVGGSLTVSGDATVNGSTSLGNGSGDVTTITRASASASFIDNNSALIVKDLADAAGVGGGIEFQGTYTTGTQTSAALIKAMKTNGTAGNYSFDLVLGTRPNGGNLTEVLRLYDGAVNTGAKVTGALSVTHNTTLGSASTDTHTANGTLNVQGLVTKKQTFTTTGIQTVTVNTDTTLIEFNAASQIDLVGLTGGTDGRVLVLRNKGTGNVKLYEENTNATAANRFVLADNLSAGFLVNSGGMALAVYDGTASRWYVAWLLGFYAPQNFSSLGSITALTFDGQGGNLSCDGNLTAGDASTDTHTLNGNLTLANAPTAGSIKVGSANGRILIAQQILTASSGTYTPTTGTKAVRVRMVGGGGGGGGATATAGNVACAGGGASGAYWEKWIDPAATVTSTGTYAVGAAGSAGSSAGGAGGAGGDTSINIQGTTYTAKGGGGAAAGTTTTTANRVRGGALPSTSTAGYDALAGTHGEDGTLIANGTAGVIPGRGGGNPLGIGGRPADASVGATAAQGYGAGGYGAFANPTGTAGGAGTAGVIIIEEYA